MHWMPYFCANSNISILRKYQPHGGTIVQINGINPLVIINVCKNLMTIHPIVDVLQSEIPQKKVTKFNMKV